MGGIPLRLQANSSRLQQLSLVLIHIQPTPKVQYRTVEPAKCLIEMLTGSGSPDLTCITTMKETGAECSMLWTLRAKYDWP